MPTKFTTSTNIIRDSTRDLNYIPTPNSIKIVNQIASDFKKGIRSFNIIGSYGTGKSTFLWALQQSLNKKKDYFSLNLLPNPTVKTINFVGEYKSIIECFVDYFEVKATKHLTENIFSEIFNHYHDIKSKNPLLVIIIDEFGKFLEFSSQNEPEKELYFIQQLSEFANNPDHNIVLITTLHQNFDAYAFSLNNAQRQEWAKVKGRFKEITFNEPIEQLLFLASEHINGGNTDDKKNKEISQAINIAKTSKAFSINSEYSDEIAYKLYPLDIISANILTLSLQKYGQNERSLFSFLESTDYTGIYNFNKKNNPFYNAACVYDYIVFNFYSFINSRYNPDFGAWCAIKNSLDTVERVFVEKIYEYTQILKTIGLLNINSASGSNLNKEFLVSYASICLGINDADILIDNLENKKIILYRNYSKRYILFEGTDLDISSELIKAGNKVTEISDVATILNRFYQLPQVYAKAYSYKNGTPRLFEFKISEHPISDIPKDEIDGFINLIFNEKLAVSEIKGHSANQHEAIIYGFYKNSKTIKNQLFEIEKTRKVIEENQNDVIAVKELKNILIHQQNLLNHYILFNLYSKKSEIIWFYNGQEAKIDSKKGLNKKLSEICESVYFKAPTFKNELVNKHRISSSIHTAKKNYLRALVDNWNKPDLGFETNKFPPEKTIYLTLLKENGIKLISDEVTLTTQISETSSFNHLWKYSHEFLESAKLTKKTVAEFILPLTKKPFKLKQGLIDFWVGTFLFIKRDDYALFGLSGYIPYITDEILELVMKYPQDYEIKTFNIEGVKLNIFNSYRLFLNQASKDKIDNNSFIETIKPFLTFYKGLTEYAKNTKQIKKETIAIRDAIVYSKDPEKSFFEDFPIALGFNQNSIQEPNENLRSFVVQLEKSIKELRTCQDNLYTRFEDFIIAEFIGSQVSFEEYKQKLQERFANLKKYLCQPHQKTFIQRLDSKLDDRKAWLNSIAQSVIGKSLETIKDEDEIQLYDKFKSLILELDTLTNISIADTDDNIEEVVGIEMSSFIDGIRKKLVRVPKNKVLEIDKIADLINGILSKDKSINIAALVSILKEQL